MVGGRMDAISLGDLENGIWHCQPGFVFAEGVGLQRSMAAAAVDAEHAAGRVAAN
ncbi:hypothetical protein FHS26_006647 [Rhizobium pisi]|uniref:Uncharacterized protein n=1 Tax=Rhizobium pisi TaxID=574561 RepID=A0A7W5BVE7_9HYPH|nr:hypothetical protein [Rhizobium pisi]